MSALQTINSRMLRTATQRGTNIPISKTFLKKLQYQTSMSQFKIRELHDGQNASSWIKCLSSTNPSKVGRQLPVSERDNFNGKVYRKGQEFSRMFSSAPPPIVAGSAQTAEPSSGQSTQPTVNQVAQANSKKKMSSSPPSSPPPGVNIDPLTPKVTNFVKPDERQADSEAAVPPEERYFREEDNYVEDAASLVTARRVDPATVRQVFYFDTLALSKKLESKGFTREQAEACAECLVEIINTTLDHQGRHMVTKPQQEIAVQQLYSEIVSVKKDLTLLQKSEFSHLKTETQKMNIQMNQIQDHLNDEIIKLKGHFSLDINLEKGRAIEAHAANEKKLQILHNKIEMDVANLKTMFEKYRNDIFKYAGGSVIAVGSLLLGVIRLMH